MLGAAHRQTEAAESSAMESQDPEQQLPALWHWRGAFVPVTRAVGLALPELTSCPDLDFLLLDIPWLSCSGLGLPSSSAGAS